MYLTESQANRVQTLVENIETNSIGDTEFTNILFELQDEGIDVEKAMLENYGVEL